ncbi:MAG TPA: hypothetical protein PL110_18090 [Candidatus Eremiobacteraeota bacterium]|nr:MAG: hypothetical protein BWY64_03113 [bacterium ADurb.Bin363]HPZ10007.1 hypothetical protein [Candidatus Eremiobacteraeota bacterium]
MDKNDNLSCQYCPLRNYCINYKEFHENSFDDEPDDFKKKCYVCPFKKESSKDVILVIPISMN